MDKKAAYNLGVQLALQAAGIKLAVGSGASTAKLLGLLSRVEPAAAKAAPKIERAVAKAAPVARPARSPGFKAWWERPGALKDSTPAPKMRLQHDPAMQAQQAINARNWPF
jgi:hypothetical protein